MPPPMPLFGASAWYSSGSHSRSDISSAKSGSIAAHAASGPEV